MESRKTFSRGLDEFFRSDGVDDGASKQAHVVERHGESFQQEVQLERSRRRAQSMRRFRGDAGLAGSPEEASSELGLSPTGSPVLAGEPAGSAGEDAGFATNADGASGLSCTIVGSATLAPGKDIGATTEDIG